MSESFDSVYPDLLKAGLDKLRSFEAQRELLGFFSSLEHFHDDLGSQETSREILDISWRYLVALDLFPKAGFWLVNPEDFGFELVLASPTGEREELKKLVGLEIKAGRFAFALKQQGPVFFQSGFSQNSDHGVMHSLVKAGQVMGMFCGLLKRGRSPAQEVAFSLFSMLLSETADALVTLHKTRQLTHQIETLSGLLPVCAWCKKVRNDSGYWEQIEKYLSIRSGAAVTHGVCPDCRIKFLGLPAM